MGHIDPPGSPLSALSYKAHFTSDLGSWWLLWSGSQSLAASGVGPYAFPYARQLQAQLARRPFTGMASEERPRDSTGRFLPSENVNLELRSSGRPTGGPLTKFVCHAKSQFGLITQIGVCACYTTRSLTGGIGGF